MAVAAVSVRVASAPVAAPETPWWADMKIAKDLRDHSNPGLELRLVDCSNLKSGGSKQ